MKGFNVYLKKDSNILGKFLSINKSWNVTTLWYVDASGHIYDILPENIELRLEQW